MTRNTLTGHGQTAAERAGDRAEFDALLAELGPDGRLEFVKRCAAAFADRGNAHMARSWAELAERMEKRQIAAASVDQVDDPLAEQRRAYMLSTFEAELARPDEDTDESASESTPAYLAAVLAACERHWPRISVRDRVIWLRLTSDVLLLSGDGEAARFAEDIRTVAKTIEGKAQRPRPA